MTLDAQGQFVTKSRINIYEALALFSFDLKQSNVVKRHYGVGNEVADGVITELLSEGLLEEPKHKRNWYRLTFRGQERLEAA
jgi:predicted transcriptional regulator